MKIAIFADLHGNVEALESIKKNIIPNVDEVWFLGDLYFDYKNDDNTSRNRKIVYDWFKSEAKNKLKIIISGNCDNKETSEIEFFNKEQKIIKEVFGRKFLLEHGHEFKEENKKNYLLDKKCDALISGHTHIGRILIEDGMVYLNPGSVSFPRDEANIPTYLLLNEEVKSISLLSVDENELIQELIIY